MFCQPSYLPQHFPFGRRKIRPRLMRLAWLVTIVSFALPGCNRQRQIKVEMTWECAPEHFMPESPDAQPVRFRYVANPHYEEVVSGRGLCDQLKASEKKVVVVEYEAWGDYFHGLVGYNEVFVDGKRIVGAGGWGSSGSDTTVGPHPLAQLFKSQ
jgi:hypothetical protein